jgi:quercetin dioxygenase-like cupin family protein
VIAFEPRGDTDPKQINHQAKDVVCHVLKGSGRLRLDDRTIDLDAGTICHIPKGIPHDFAAGKEEGMVLLYSLITTG